MPDPVCPICGRPADAKRRPFCSARCTEVDLGRWFTGQYCLPVGRTGQDDELPDGADEG